jgi:hypothetical protein
MCTGHPIVHCPVPATSPNCGGLEQSTVEFACPYGAPDSLLAHRTVRCDLTSLTISELLTFLTRSSRAEVDHWRRTHRTVWCTPDNMVNFSRGALHFPESGQFVGRSSLGTRHFPLHIGQSNAPQAGAILIFPILIKLAHGSFSLYVYMNFMHIRKDQLGKLVSP